MTKKELAVIIVATIIFSIIALHYYPIIRSKIEANCNARGGSYL